jgi:hypothetical protein
LPGDEPPESVAYSRETGETLLWSEFSRRRNADIDADEQPTGDSTPAQLKAQGYERFTVRKMCERFNTSADRLDVMAKRLLEEGQLADYKIITPKKQPQLWALVRTTS